MNEAYLTADGFSWAQLAILRQALRRQNDFVMKKTKLEEPYKEYMREGFDEMDRKLEQLQLVIDEETK